MPDSDTTVVEVDGPCEMLAWAMKQSGARQIDVAKFCNVTVGTVANWVHGRTAPGSEQFVNACAACGFNVVLEPMIDE